MIFLGGAIYFCKQTFLHIEYLLLKVHLILSPRVGECCRLNLRKEETSGMSYKGTLIDWTNSNWLVIRMFRLLFLVWKEKVFCSFYWSFFFICCTPPKWDESSLKVLSKWLFRWTESLFCIKKNELGEFTSLEARDVTNLYLKFQRNLEEIPEGIL